MLAKSIISDQNFLTKRRIELAQNKNVVERQGWFRRPKGFILQKKTWSLLRNVKIKIVLISLFLASKILTHQLLNLWN